MFAISLPLIIVNYAIESAMTSLAQVGRNANWTQVKINFDAHVRAFIPGERFDDLCVRAANHAIDSIAKASQDAPDFEAILKEIAAKNWAGARAALALLVSKAAGPELASLLASEASAPQPIVGDVDSVPVAAA